MFTRRDVTLGLLTSLGVGVVLVLQLLTMASSNAPGFLRLDLVFHQPASRAEAMVARMDGHFTAELAADPTLDRTRRDFAPDPTDGAYRSSRPLLGWVTWALSLGGRRPLLAPAILVLAAASAGALTVAVALVARSLGWAARAPWLILFAPGALIAVWNPGLTEVLATTLALAGFVAHRRGRAGWAVLLFSLAVLSRETTFLIPAALVAGDVITHRRWRSLSLVAVPAVCYVAWSQVVQQLLGHTSGAGGARQLSLPGVGFVGAIPFWGPLELAGLLVVLVSAVVAWRSGDREVRLVVLAFVAFASVMGTIVWSEWWGFGRVFLPLAAFGVASFRTDDRGAGACTATSETGAVPEVALNR